MKKADLLSNFQQRPIREGAKYGSIAGVIATWSISTAIAASELELGLPISTFYTVIGISLGLNDLIASAYLGFGLHLGTGTLLGAIIGALAVKIETRRNISNLFSASRSILMGVGTGVLIWLVLFLPISAMLIQPSIGKISENLQSGQSEVGLSVFEASNLSQSFMGIVTSAIAFHVVWGAIFGFIISSLLKIKSHSSKLSESFGTSQQNRQTVRSPLTIVYFGLVAGLISSLAVSGLILLVEKINSLPVGTFYYVLVSALTNPYSSNTETVIIMGLVMHLAAGSFLGLIMSIPFVHTRNNNVSENETAKREPFLQKYSSVYGIAFGVGLWLLIFLPTTFLIVIPLLESFELQDIMIRQRVPTGQVAETTFYGLLPLMDRIIYGALAFNIFYGLLTAILLQSFSERYHSTINNIPMKQKEDDLAKGQDGRII
jgi:hypothetical protein